MFRSRQERQVLGLDPGSTTTLHNIAGDEDEDLYSFDKRPVTTSYGRAAWTSAGRTSAGQPGQTSYGGRVATAFRSAGDGDARPMTSMRAAGYTSRGRAGMAAGQAFDPFNQAARTASASGGGYHKLEETPEEQIRKLEQKVTALVEESAIAASEGNLSVALERAKDAGKKERQLSRHREQLELADQMNLDLTYCVLFNLANQYEANQMYQEALNTYSVIVKNKMFNQSGRLRVNMGNIYFAQKKYTQAIKMYRMALDQVSGSNREIRLRIMRNIGIAFIRMGQFQDAITSFEAIMEGSPDFHAGFNLILCYFALGDKERMKRGLQRLTSIRPVAVEQNDDFGSPNTTSEPIEDRDLFNEDELRAVARKKQHQAERFILLASKLIAPTIEGTVPAGYDWIVEMIKASPHAAIASDIEIAKALQFLKAKDFNKAVDTLKAFEKTDQKMMATAATNLSFLYFLDGDLKQAERYADAAISADRYNAKAHTNRGNCAYVRGDYDKARQYYQEAVSVDAVCTEAMYNLGLANKQSGRFSEALQWFEKLYSMLRNSAEVIYQIADICEKQGNIRQAMEWLNILISVVPTDPGVLARLGKICVRDGDKTQAFQYYSESYRYFPSNMDTIAWLGAYYVECEMYEQAIQFFERGVMIQPQEVKWQLMIASCHRRIGNYQQSLETYKRIHEKFPENVECLRFLVRICTDLGMKEVHEYAERLSRAERAKDREAEAAAIMGNKQGDVNDGAGSGVSRASLRSTGTDTPSKPPLSQSMLPAEKIDPNPTRRPQTARQPKMDDDWHEDVGNLLPE
ncbi:hypothetical protein BC832DRAFT_546444 [Gaertneriomyces semiglobifer]|nr:hypothetical protein BC832DRAFT_546444 [Gaertneriomyces semiglobifer]